MNPEFLISVLTTDGMFALLNCAIQGMMAHFGSSTTHAAEEIAVIICKIVNNSSSKESKGSDRKVFKSFLEQNQYRNLKLQNEFFAINWKLLLAVINSKSKHVN